MIARPWRVQHLRVNIAWNRKVLTESRLPEPKEVIPTGKDVDKARVISRDNFCDKGKDNFGDIRLIFVAVDAWYDSI